MAETKKPKRANVTQSASSDNILIGGNVDKSVVIKGDHAVVHYYAADGEKREMRTGWFFGHRYGDLENFTGRADEMQMLDEWLGDDKDNLLVLRALGGFGKSALTWQWFNHRVDKTKWQTAVWWSFYEKESGFESFLAETLAHLGVEVKQSARMQLNDLLEAMRGTNTLIVLDGFERLLRQYGRMDAALQSDDEDAEIDPSQRDCSSPLTETFLRGLSGVGMKSKVLMTTRLCPRALESADGKLLKGCRDEALSAFSPDDAVTYFHNEGIAATRAEILALCAAYGYHPLSLSLLVGLINADHEWRGDIEAVKNLEIFEDVKARRHHVLERAYGSLAPERRDLLSKISCFRGSMEYAVLKKVFPSPDLDKALLDLRQRGLLRYIPPLLLGAHLGDDKGAGVRYDMHPIVRHYAYDRFTDSERKKTHKDLAFHFIDVMVDAMPSPKTKVKTLEDLAPVIELYHHMVGAGNLQDAAKLLSDRLVPNPLHFQFGAYQLMIELKRALFLDGEDKPPRLKNESTQAWTLSALANSYSASGQPLRAVSLFEMAIAITEKIGDKKNTAVSLGNVADDQLKTGALSAAERNLHRCIDLSHGIADKYIEARANQGIGHLHSILGLWNIAKQALEIALDIVEIQKQIQPQSSIWSYFALRSLLMAREQVISNLSPLNSVKSAIESAGRAIELADETVREIYPSPRDHIRSYWLLGAAYRANNELTLAEENLSKALNLCRQINLVMYEADILLDLARLSFAYALREAQGSAQDELFKDAQEKASEALVITERSGYVLQGADVNLFLAELALAGYRLEGLKVGNFKDLSDKEIAKRHAEEAKKLATGWEEVDGKVVYDTTGKYVYKVAYDEAVAMLERLS